MEYFERKKSLAELPVHLSHFVGEPRLRPGSRSHLQIELGLESETPKFLPALPSVHVILISLTFDFMVSIFLVIFAISDFIRSFVVQITGTWHISEIILKSMYLLL